MKHAKLETYNVGNSWITKKTSSNDCHCRNSHHGFINKSQHQHNLHKAITSYKHPHLSNRTKTAKGNIWDQERNAQFHFLGKCC